MRMQNKIGIVTAAGSGMGRAGAIRFTKEGASVAVVDLNPDAAAAVVKTITDAGGKAIALSGDLTDNDFARGIVRETTKAFGALDFLWNHVGSPGPASIEGLDWNDYDFTMNPGPTDVISGEFSCDDLSDVEKFDALAAVMNGTFRDGSKTHPVHANIEKSGFATIIKLGVIYMFFQSNPYVGFWRE